MAIPSNNQQSGLSYDRDIAPLKQQFFRQAFRNPTVEGAKASAIASMRVSDAYDDAYKTALSFRDAEEVSRNRQLQYDSSLFELEQAREKANRERTIMQDLKPVSDLLSGIYNDPNLSLDQKNSAVASNSIKFAGAIAKNPAIATAFDATVKGLARATDERITPTKYLQAGGDIETLDTYAAETGVTIDNNFNVPYSVLAKGYQEGLRKASEAKAKSTAYSEREQRAFEGTKKLMEGVSDADIFTDLSGVSDPTKFKSPNDEYSVTGIISAFGSPEQIAAASKASAADKIRIAQGISSGWLLSGGQRAAPQTQRRHAGSFATQ